MPVADYALDNGLGSIDTLADKIYICSALPTTYGQATTGGAVALGNKNFGSAGAAVGSPVDATPNGRKVATIAVSGGVITNNGNATHWAIVDSANSRLLAAGTLTSTFAVTTAQSWTLPSFEIIYPDRPS